MRRTRSSIPGGSPAGRAWGRAVPAAAVLVVLALSGAPVVGRSPSSKDDEAAGRRLPAAGGTLWYVGDGLIDEAHGRPRTLLLVYNPADRPAAVAMRVYRAARPPGSATLEVAAGRVAEWELAAFDAVPRGEPFWLTVESDAPILPQLVHADFAPGDPVPDALISVAPHPGPLSTETSWTYPDGFVGGAEKWIEDETITILNPGKRPVTARLTYMLDGRAAVERVEIAARRLLALDAGSRRPRLDDGAGESIGIGGDYALRIDSSAPIVTQKTRRARLQGESWIVGARSTMAFPRTDPAPRVWYYPGGYDAVPAAGGGEPWNLLFTLNPDPAGPARTTLTLHGPRGRRARLPEIEIAPLTSDLRWLHHWKGAYLTHEPWALTLRASRPVVAELTSAEFERRSDACPGAMTAVNLCAEPLDRRRSQWLGIGRIGPSREGGAWTQDYALFNPGDETARATLSFLGFEGHSLHRRLSIPPGAVTRVDAAALQGLPRGPAFAVRVDADRPLCAQVVVRSLGGSPPYTRAMYSFVGVPTGSR